MSDSASVTLLANAAVYIELGSTSFLFDGLYQKRGHPFPLIPQPLREALMEGKAPFPPPRYLVFTHLHPDHFSSAELIRYLEINPVTGVLLPQDHSQPDLEEESITACRWLVERDIPFRPLEYPFGGRVRFRPEPDVEVLCFNTGHLGPQFAVESNYCSLLKAAGKNILVTGDAETALEYFSAALAGERVDAMLINPMFYQHPKGKEVIRALAPREVILYHIPFPESDQLNLGRMVERQLRRHEIPESGLRALTDTLQKLDL